MATQVRPNVWLGNSRDARTAQFLSENNIHYVFNVAIDLDYPFVSPTVMFSKVGLHDGPGNQPTIFSSAVRELRYMISSGKNVLVHCHMGMSRSPVVLARALAELEKKDFDSVLADLKTMRPIIDPNEHLIALGRLP